MVMRRVLLSLVLAAAAIAPGAAFAWGGQGHRLIGVSAAAALPPEIPAFLRTPQAIADIGELSREPDRSNGGGKAHDADRNPGHFVDLMEDGVILGGASLARLPATREDYDTALRAGGMTSWKAGYLPYTIVDRWQQVARDFAYWRALDAAARNPAWSAHRAWFVADRRRREALLLHSLGELSHYVGDGSQPLHVTAHYNGWGDYPNPGGYTQAKIHAPFEGALVLAAVKPRDVTARMTPLRTCGCAIEARTADYLAETGRRVIPLYELEKSGGIRPEDPRGRVFAAVQIARGASELRDLIVEAWRASAAESVGWKPVPVADIVAGRIDPYAALTSID
jgi:hypothetical protein